MDSPSTYTIEVDHGQTEGHLFYVERGQKLPFTWNTMKIPGRQVVIPTVSTWHAFCVQHNAPWAVDRREEIVKRLGDGLAKHWYGGGSHNRSGDGSWQWLCVYPAPSRLERILNRLFVWVDLFK